MSCLTVKNTQAPLVSIIVVNYNGIYSLKRCLVSLMKLAYSLDRLDVLLVDNGSNDHSVKWIRDNYREVKILRNKKNLGFSKANNLGIKQALIDRKVNFIGLVNNDVILEKDWLRWSLDVLQRRPKAGCVTGKTFSKRTGRFDSVGVELARDFRFVKRGNGEKDLGQYDLEREVVAANFAAALCRRKMLEDVNIKGEFLDNDFFAYYEDVDLCLRAKMKGWQSWYQPKAICHHIGSYTSSQFGYKFIIFHSLRNRIWMITKNFPSSMLLKALLKQLLPAKDSVYSRDIKKLSFISRILIFVFASLSAFVKMPKMLKKRYFIYNDLSQERIKRWEKELTSQLY